MSAVHDFESIWLEKYPGSKLPQAWEEDVKTNLAKHKRRVRELSEELNSEQVYVQFLESLLEEVDKRKPPNDLVKNEDEDIEGDDHSKKRSSNNNSSIESFKELGIESSQTEEFLEGSFLLDKRSLKCRSLESKITENNSTIDVKSEEENNENVNDICGPSSLTTSIIDDNASLKDHFITVIEVNGIEKEKSLAATTAENSSRNSGNTQAQLQPPKAEGMEKEKEKPRKVPPRPPPKNLKRNTGQENPINSKIIKPPEPLFTSFGIKGPINKLDQRPVIFDSKKSSSSSSTSANVESNNNSMNGNGNSNTNSNINVNINSTNNAAKGIKRFEGSRFPLPSPSLQQKFKNNNCSKEEELQSKQQSSYPSAEGKHSSPLVNENHRSKKIFEMVNKMESSKKPMIMNKNIEQTPTKSSSRRQQFPLQYHHRHQKQQQEDTVISDYIDPLDADFEYESMGSGGGGDQIYDSPPVEDLEEDEDNNDNNFSEQIQSKSSNVLASKNETAADDRDYENTPVDDLESEPMYDCVAPDQEDQEDDYVLLEEGNNNSSTSNTSLSKKEKNSSTAKDSTIKSQTSIISGQSITTTSSGTDTEGFTNTGSPLPQDESKMSSSNYVNIDYFLNKSKRKDSKVSVDESEDDDPPLLRAISFDQYTENSSESSPSHSRGPGDRINRINSASLESFDLDSGVYGSAFDSIAVRKGGNSNRAETATINIADQEKYTMFRSMITNIAESESSYVEVLNVMLQYMKALKATLATSKPVLSHDDFNIIFYKIPELFTLHQSFLQGLQQNSPNANSVGVGGHFENLSRETSVYGAFLQNYSRAVDIVRKCCRNPEFAEITRSIRLRSMNKNQAVSLETLLYSPVSRVQKNVEIIQDLLKCLPESNPDYKSLKYALSEFQSFLTEFKMIQPEQLFHGQDRSPRHLVKNSFIVELSEGHRKLRHIFLFNDVFVCAKYKASGKDKFTFELKWYIPVAECIIIEESTEPREYTPVNLVALRTQASTVRDQIKRQTSREDPKKAKAEKQRKKLAELEAQLVLASPNLVFKVKHGNGKAYTFFLSSEYERSQWIDSIEALKANQPTTTTNLSMNELQTWLTSCRNHLKTNMGSYLLRTGRDENLLVGDFYLLIKSLKGILRPGDLYICLEVDSYGHFFRKAKTKMICESTAPVWDQDFIIELEGAQNIRILLYEDHPRQGTLLRAKTTIELNRNWLTSSMTERKIDLQDFVLTLATKFIPSEMTLRRVPAAKPSGLFGAKITQVCKREKRQVPFIITSCVREVERRGINEVGIYRVSGSASDVSKLKKAFETNAYEAEQLLKEVDIHSVTGALKLYMRELPEALFTDEFYPKFFEAFNLSDVEIKRKTLLQLFSNLPPINQHIVLYFLDHMTRINLHENHNKMSLHNMATVFGPTLLRPGINKNEGPSSSSDSLASGTVDVMAQAGILYFFLTRRATGEALPTLPEST